MPAWTLLVPVVVAVAVYLFQFLAAHLPANVRDEATKLVDIAVAAIEQSMPGATGEDKKAAAMSLLRAIARDLHLSVPDALLSALIEATVGAMNQAQAEDAPPADPSPVGFHAPDVAKAIAKAQRLHAGPLC